MSRTLNSRSPRRVNSFHPQLEVLEDRLAPGTVFGASPLVDPGSLGAARHRQESEIAVLTGLAAGHAQASVRTTSDVISFADGTVKGSSTLIRTDNGISVHLTTSGLQQGAYSVWWVVIEEGAFKVGNATGRVVGPEGTATFAAHLNEGETLVGHPTLSGGSLQDARQAEIRVVIRFHGPADLGRIFEQTHTFEPGVGVDAQRSIHPAP